jgi:hypothetical protein
VRDALARLKISLNPASIISDFESGLIETVRLQFPSARHLGCHFHFGQALFRKVQDEGLVISYRDVDTIRIFVEKCNALAFVPPAEVRGMFDELVNLLSVPDQHQLQGFIAYFRSTWLNGNFSIDMWNKYGADIHHRTNNAMESWHATLKLILPAHPNIYVLIGVLKQQQALAKVNIAKAAAGQSPPKRKAKYRKLEEKLQKLNEKHVLQHINTNQLLTKVHNCVNTAKK